MFDQLSDRFVAAIAVDGVVVEIAGDRETTAGGQTAAAALVVAQPAAIGIVVVQIVAPQPQFVGVARAVAVLGAVEHRRGGVRDQEMQYAARCAHRHVPVRFRRQPQLPPDRIRIERSPRLRIDGSCGVRHRAPLQQPEAAHLGGVDRMTRQHQHAVLAGMQTVAPGIVAAVAALAADGAVAVQIQAAGHAGVHRREIAIRIAQRLAVAALRHFQIVPLEEVSGAAFGVVVEFIEQHQIGTHALQHAGDAARGGISGFESPDQSAVGVVVQRHVVGRDPQRGRCGNGSVRIAMHVDAHAACAYDSKGGGDKPVRDAHARDQKRGRHIHCGSSPARRDQPWPSKASSGR